MASKIYVSKKHTGEPTAVILAPNRQMAEVSFQAMGAEAHTVEEIDPNADNLGVHGVVFLLTSSERSSHDYSHIVGGWTFRQWKRGL